MSYANGRSIRRARLRKVGRAASAVQGCTCRPDIKVGTARGHDQITVKHDVWCPLYNAGFFLVCYDPDVYGGRCER